MKFGSVDNPSQIDFSLPDDHPDTAETLSDNSNAGKPKVHVGCAKWSPKELKDFYPEGVGDELEYYSTQFSAVELNATFYRNFPADQVAGWREKVPEHFRFFPKVYRQVSHLKWLSGVEEATEHYLDSIAHFENNLGTIFLQLRDNFKPKFFDRVQTFIETWPEGFPLAVEFRHPDWFHDEAVANELYALLEENDVANVIVDTAGRRDLLHMRLTNNEAFVRYVGANHPTDYTRLEDWVQRLKTWADQGLENIHFFVHQNEERESPRLSAHFIKKLNEEAGTNLKIPKVGGGQSELF